MSHVLVHDEIINELIRPGFIENASVECVDGDSYDIRVGDEALIVDLRTGEMKKKNLREEKVLDIPPLAMAIVKSMEKIRMPEDMDGDLWLRGELQSRGFGFTGGGIDPGYKGYLFIRLHNISPRTIRVRYGERIASVRFRRLHKKTRAYAGEQIETLPPQWIPELPEIPIYDWAEISKKLKEHDERLGLIRRVVIAGVLGGVIAGIIVGILVYLLTWIFSKLLPLVVILLRALPHGLPLALSAPLWPTWPHPASPEGRRRPRPCKCRLGPWSTWRQALHARRTAT